MQAPDASQNTPSSLRTLYKVGDIQGKCALLGWLVGLSIDAAVSA